MSTYNQRHVHNQYTIHTLSLSINMLEFIFGRVYQNINIENAFIALTAEELFSPCYM